MRFRRVPTGSDAFRRAVKEIGGSRRVSHRDYSKIRKPEVLSDLSQIGGQISQAEMLADM
jgi:hypothetical protein